MTINAALLKQIEANDPTLTKLDFLIDRITDSDMEQLAEKFAQNTTITTFFILG